MVEKIRYNEFGENINCAFYSFSKMSNTYECTALRDWYNEGALFKRCNGCTFFKTKAEIERQFKKCSERLARLNGIKGE